MYNIGYRFAIDGKLDWEIASGSIMCKTDKGFAQAIRETLRSVADDVRMQEALGNTVHFIFWRNPER